MFAFQHRSDNPQFQPHAFLPITPSPLSPRRHSQAIFNPFNQAHVPRSFTNHPMNALEQEQAQKSNTRSVERRYRPELHATARGALAQKRRDIFHRKVQNQREDKTWARRGEELERLDDRNEWRKWEMEALSLAPVVNEDELDEVEGDAQQQQLSSEEADEIARMEEGELAALVEMLEVQQAADMGLSENLQADQDEHFGSDDEDYESIFAGIESDVSHQPARQTVEGGSGGIAEDETERMDLS